ncbi:hypothetical protein [Vreelandella alkaliphila]|uniref:Uncharacterized protein n=1 Tax=Vreelandella alkaliphila TaxID=272774 RepID=A0AAJ2S2I4_9GAMM|nr:hypothetical protein [Halomonas alkaliphila]MDX5979612.1 hypothetical protein [Halomonas alkaliphila]
MTNTQEFARRMKRELDAFNDKRSPGQRPRRPVKRHKPESARHLLVVKLAVRKKHIAQDEPYYHFSERLSQLEAEIDAKREAVAAGYIVGHVVFIKKAMDKK